MKAEGANIAIALAFAVVATSLANAAPIIAPTSATASSTIWSSNILHTIDQSGLSLPYTSGVTDFDSYIASNPTHSFLGIYDWFSDTDATTVTITYDLGRPLTIDRLALWHEDGAGFTTGAISVSLDAVTFNALTIINPVNVPLAEDYPAQVFGLGIITTRYLRLVISGCPQSNDIPGQLCGIGEVAFAAVPEPGTLVLFTLGIGALAVARRNKPSLERLVAR